MTFTNGRIRISAVCDGVYYALLEDTVMMRITNAMMTSNTKNNININKLNEDRLNTQIATGQVISRPSEDPVVAIRALRLNTNLSQLTQYYKKNIPDSQAWLNVTETALKQTDQIFTNIKENLTTGSTGTNTPTDRQKILESLKALRAELYSSGNADYAERTVFTDYRTQKSLTFLETDTDLNENYQIHETFGLDSIEKIDYVTTYTTDETNVQEVPVYRIRLAYDENDPNNGIDHINLPNGETINVNTVSIAGKSQADIDQAYTNTSGGINYIPETGELIFSEAAKTKYDNAFNATDLDRFTVGGKTAELPKGSFDGSGNGVISLSDDMLSMFDPMPSPSVITLPGGNTYNLTTSAPGADEIQYDSASKRLVFGANVNKTDPTDPNSPKKFRSGDTSDVDYNKNKWKSGDLRPEHYFACVQTIKGEPDPIYYNYDQRENAQGNLEPDPTKPNFVNKDMIVEISFNQKISINTHANEVYTHDIGRDIDELVKVTQAVVDCDETVAKLEKGVAEGTATQKELDAAKKEYSLKKEKMQKMFSAAFDKFDVYADRNNVAIANIGSMQQRLTITKERVADQLQSFKELADANINAELTESSIDFASAKLALEAAQMAAGKIAQQTLLNYL